MLGFIGCDVSIVKWVLVFKGVKVDFEDERSLFAVEMSRDIFDCVLMHG